ncbi:hypothetical protein Alg215_11016, partial [Pyrenophora tritici-repentis]
RLKVFRKPQYARHVGAEHPTGDGCMSDFYLYSGLKRVNSAVDSRKPASTGLYGFNPRV